MSARLHRWWASVVRRLDKRGTRALLIVPASLWMSASQRTPCLVYWSDGAWIHRYPGAKIPHAALGRAARPGVFTAEARAVFTYEYTPQAGDVVFDVGAGVGAETLLFARLVGKRGRVVALEAHPRTYERLARLCSINRLTNVVPLHVAAGDADGEALITDSPNHLRNTTVGATGDGVRVRARRLDSIAGELGLTRIDLLKMNIEGAEILALAGLEGIVHATRRVCISCHDFLADEGASDELRTKRAVRAWLIERGFRVTSRDDAPEPWLRDYLYGSRD